MIKTEKRYGLMTGIAMIIGVVIGSGIFIKSGDVLKASGGNIYVSLIAWLIGGVIMIASGFCFAKFATKVVRFNGLTDYVEVASNERTAYYVSYFMSTLYYPITSAAVSIYTARFALNLGNITDPNPWMLFAIAFMILTFLMFFNYLSPWLSNKFQISAMFIKLIPLLIIVVAAVFGNFIPGISRNLISPFLDPKSDLPTSFGEAVKITSFAYNGWVAATALNAEMKNSKRDLPRALMIGTILIVIAYLLIFIGLITIVGNEQIVKHPENSIYDAFNNIIGGAGSTILLALLFISCVGIVNANTYCSSRSILAMAVRGQGYRPNEIDKVEHHKFNILPYLIPYFITIFYLFIYTFANLKYPVFEYMGDFDNIVCSIIYSSYIIIYIYMIKNFKELNKFSRFVMPIISIVGALFMLLCGMGIIQIIEQNQLNALYSFLLFMLVCILSYIPAEISWRKNKNPKS